ncbi:restriction endonuclease subunit S [Streptomyces barkulensis]|uniref:restriction endonuclease subunit S n=2 Tax=Streptomyces barkulensis TaxID=1257026 RepID=UPI000D1B592D|nr:restriction endonuclease subunit S [Streptomyces barkulensis]
MSDWQHVPAGKIAHQRREIVRLEPGTEYRTMGVRWYGRGAYDRGVVTTETVKAKSLYRVREGDFTFNRIDTQKGAFDVVPEDLDGALATNEFPLYKVNEEEVDARFLLLNFQRSEVLQQIGAMRAGSEGRARWKEADFEAWMVPVPPLPVQRRIIEVISAMDDQITALDKEAEALVSCTDLRGVPQAWVTLPGVRRTTSNASTP